MKELGVLFLVYVYFYFSFLMFVVIVLVNPHETKTRPLGTSRGLKACVTAKCHRDFLRKWIRLDSLIFILFCSRTSKKLSVGVFDKFIKNSFDAFLPLVFVMFRSLSCLLILCFWILGKIRRMKLKDVNNDGKELIKS